LPGFEFLEHISDIYVKGHGKDLKQALVNCARGLTAVLVRNPEMIRQSQSRSVKIRAKHLQELIYLWLEEFIFLFDSEGFLFKRFNGKIRRDHTTYLLTGILKGEKFDPRRHRPGIHIKGVTYHDLTVKISRNRTTITVLLDI